MQNESYEYALRGGHPEGSGGGGIWAFYTFPPPTSFLTLLCGVSILLFCLMLKLYVCRDLFLYVHANVHCINKRSSAVVVVFVWHGMVYGDDVDSCYVDLF